MRTTPEFLETLRQAIQDGEEEAAKTTTFEPGSAENQLHRVVVLSSTFKKSVADIGTGFVRLGNKGLEFVIMVDQTSI